MSNMGAGRTVLLLGATGRTGRRVLEQLLERGIHVRAIVRSPDKLPPSVVDDPKLTVIEAEVLSLSDEQLARCVDGCDAVISCLGHVTDLKGIFGPPRDLVTRATTRVCGAIESNKPAQPVKFVLMSSVSVNDPRCREARRSAFDRAVLWMLRGLVPPARDNQSATDFLCEHVGTGRGFVQWVAVRPDTLLEGDVTPCALHESLASGLFAPDETNMANVAHFMCELVTQPTLWDHWSGRLPVIVNAAGQGS